MKHLFSSPVVDTVLSVYPTTSKVRAPFPQLLWVLAANGSQLPPSLESCLQLKWPTLSGSYPKPTTDRYWVYQQMPSQLIRTIWKHPGDCLSIRDVFRVCSEYLFLGMIHWTQNREYVSVVFLLCPVTHLLKVTLQRINSPLLLIVSLGPFGTSFEFRNGERRRDMRCGPQVEVCTEAMPQWWWRQSKQPRSRRQTRPENLRRCIQCILLKGWVATYLDI